MLQYSQVDEDELEVLIGLTIKDTRNLCKCILIFKCISAILKYSNKTSVLKSDICLCTSVVSMAY